MDRRNSLVEVLVIASIASVVAPGGRLSLLLLPCAEYVPARHRANREVAVVRAAILLRSWHLIRFLCRALAMPRASFCHRRVAGPLQLRHCLLSVVTLMVDHHHRRRRRR